MRSLQQWYSLTPMTGFLTKDAKAQFGRLVGLAIAPDGSVLFADDTNGVIYRGSTQVQNYRLVSDRSKITSTIHSCNSRF
jgi:hypothetical protein